MTSGPVRPKRVRRPKRYPVVPANKITRAARRWKCSCGHVNKATAKRCWRCGVLKVKEK